MSNVLFPAPMGVNRRLHERLLGCAVQGSDPALVFSTTGYLSEDDFENVEVWWRLLQRGELRISTIPGGGDERGTDIPSELYQAGGGADLALCDSTPTVASS